VTGKVLDDIVTALRTQAGIPVLEGYEWGNLQKLNLVKSNAFLRVGGASDPGSSLHDVYLAQLHDAGKAGIRAALARIVADTGGNAIALNVSRADYASNACRNIKSGLPPDQWNAKPCSSFEEYVAGVAARTLALKTPFFTQIQVSD